MNVADRHVFNTNVENVCAERDYYSVPQPDGTRTAELEKFLGNLDGVFASIVRKVSAGNRLSQPERYDFCAFVATQYLRTPRMKDFAAKAIGQLGHHTAQLLAANPERFHATINRMVEETGFRLEVEPERVREWVLAGDYDVQGTHAASVALALSPLKEIVDVLWNMKWTFFVAENDRPFMTCDDPVGFFHPWLLEGSPVPPGLVNRDTNLHIPISPNIYAIGGRKMRDGYAALPRTKIPALNRFTIARAARQLILPVQGPALIKFAVRVLDEKDNRRHAASS